MKKQDNKSNELKNRKGNLRLLVCDTSGGIAHTISDREEWVTSPIRCLDRAVEWKPDIIVLSFMNISIREREALVELSASLKRNSLTGNCIILAILPSKHRRLVEDLMRAKVDFVRYVAGDKPDPDFVNELISDIQATDCPERQLEILCSFLHYKKIDSQHEMTVCGAWRNRMVLGGKWLHELCETENHLHCEYFLNPVTES